MGKYVICLTLAAVLFALSLSAEAQPSKKVPRIGRLSPLFASADAIRKEAMPGITRVAVLSNPINPDTEFSVRGLEAAAQALRMRFRFFEVREATGFESASRAIASGR